MKPAIWFLAVRANSGADVFTRQLVASLREQDIRAEITWLPLRAEYAPWTVPVPAPPVWANLVHVNSWLSARFLPPGLPVVATAHHCVHDPQFASFKTFLQKLYHRFWIYGVESNCLQKAQIITAVSRYTATTYQEIMNVREMEVIYNGVNCDQFKPVERLKPRHPFRLLFVGNLIHRKGVELLTPIMEQLGHNFELRYTTGGKEQHGFRFPRNTQALGRVSAKQLVHEYQQADALLFPSHLEGFGLAAAEAMACGLPVIAGNNSALPEVVEDGETGFLCDHKDPQSYVRACHILANDQVKWLAMRKAARQRVLANFTEQHQCRHFIDVYRQVSHSRFSPHSDKSG